MVEKSLLLFITLTALHALINQTEIQELSIKAHFLYRLALSQNE
jgi:hypothetical protein